MISYKIGICVVRESITRVDLPQLDVEVDDTGHVVRDHVVIEYLLQADAVEIEASLVHFGLHNHSPITPIADLSSGYSKALVTLSSKCLWNLE